MYSISKTFSFCYGHRLVGDHSKCRHLHGHSGNATIVLEYPQLDHRGMVVHFDELKQTIGHWIEENFDHTMILAENDPIRTLLEEKGEKLKIIPVPPTAENLARMIFEQTEGLGYPVVRVDFWESSTSMASFKKSSASS
ncbi:MAG: 6-carboxytetrahydropterin synthase [Deltaproteobacteria bacterium]|nr:6-carboxytetrahydropterin synthase [Deltaproteobacteria bacterium]